MGTAALQQELQLSSFPSCCFPELLPGLGCCSAALCPAPNPRGGQKREVKGSPGSTSPPGCLPGKAACWESSTQPRQMVGPSWSLPQPLPTITNTSQGAESIQELLVLLQVHLPARPSLAAQLGGIRAPTSSSHCPQLSIPAGLLSVAL